jgi:hypothetical protein
MTQLFSSYHIESVYTQKNEGKKTDTSSSYFTKQFQVNRFSLLHRFQSSYFFFEVERDFKLMSTTARLM